MATVSQSFDVRMDEIIKEKNIQKFNCALYFYVLSRTLKMNYCTSM